MNAKLRDHVDLLTGFPFKSSEYCDGDGIRLLRGDNVVQGRLRWDNAKLWPKTRVLECEKYVLEVGDVVLAMDRPWIEAGLKFARISVGDAPSLLVQRVARLRAGAAIDQRYLYYLIGSTAFTDHILAVQTGTAVPHISGKQILEFQFELLPLNEQCRIAEVLGILDDKIEQNRRTGESLERLARAIFRAWFVDFEPVKAKAAGVASFPSMPQDVFDALPTELDDSSIGPIPQGWGVKRIEEVAERVAMGPFGSSIKVSTFVTEGVPVVSGQHLRGLMLDDSSFNFVTDEHAGKLQKANVRRGDVLFTHAGSIGQVAYVPAWSEHDRYVISQRQFYMRCDERQVSPIFVVLYFQSAEGQYLLLGNTSSTGVPSIARPVTYLRQLPILVPPPRCLAAFDTVADGLLAVIGSNVKQSRKLARLRDYLLPKLLSGKVRVRDAEAIAESA